MKIYKDDMTIECSAEEFLKIKDELLGEEITGKDFDCEIPGFENFNSRIEKWYSSLYKNSNYD